MAKINDKKLICVVEDDPGINELMRVVLEQNNYEVVICTTDTEIKKQLVKRKPALILMDLWLQGGVSGEKLTWAIKKRKNTRNIPIIIVSAQNSLSKIVSRSQADGYLAKPFDIAELLSTVKKYVH